MARPRTLDHRTIARAALVVVDREGLGGLSMRAVANELGVGTMSLYRYVSGREEVEGLVVDSVFLDVDVAISENASWDRNVTELSEAMRAAIAAHPAVIPLLLTHFASSPKAWQWLEALLSALKRAGFDARQRVFAVRTLQAFVVGAVQSEFHNELDGTSTVALTTLSAEFPLIVAAARTAMSISPGEEFSRGLDTVLDGLRAKLKTVKR